MAAERGKLLHPGIDLCNGGIIGFAHHKEVLFYRHAAVGQAFHYPFQRIDRIGGAGHIEIPFLIACHAYHLRKTFVFAGLQLGRFYEIVD